MSLEKYISKGFWILAISFSLAGCDQEPPQQKPNVLFISIDDLNDWIEPLGGHPQAITPNLAKLSEEGVLFTNAHCSQAVCTASRNSLLSGIHPSTTGWYHGVENYAKNYDQVMEGHKMLPQLFKDNGYKTMAVGKIFHKGVSDYPDKTALFWDEYAPEYEVTGELLERGGGYGGIRFYPFPKEGSQINNHYGKGTWGSSLCYGPLDREDMPNGKMYDELISEWAVKKLEESYENPFFMAVGFVRPHVPYTAPKEFFEKYDLEKIQIPQLPKEEMSDIPLMGKSIAFGSMKFGDHYGVVNLSDSYWRELVYGYLACVSFVDHELGKVLEALENSQYADNTIVVLWSDHGQHLGEKKHWRKQALWEESTRVPMIFKLPGKNDHPTKITQAVSLLDIYPTLTDLCGFEQPKKLEGNNLSPLLHHPETTWDKPVLSSWYYENYAVRSNRWRYIQYRDGTQELYDHENDPEEFNNLAGDNEYASIISAHQKMIPAKSALPAGTETWEGDKLDRRIKQWEENDSIPAWLR